MNSNLLSSNGSLSNNILKEECKKNHKREKITNKNFVLLRIAKINRRTDIRARNTQAKPGQRNEVFRVLGYLGIYLKYINEKYIQGKVEYGKEWRRGKGDVTT